MSSFADRRLALLDGLVYGDAFDCAPTLDELWRYARARIDRDELRRLLRDDPVLSPLVTERDGLYCLADRPELLERRRPRIASARVLQRRARRVARVIGRLPFVRGLMLTGSAAADDADGTSDVDLLVVVAPGRLGISFLMLGPASRLLGRRLFCPNYYVCEGRLGITPRSPYLAREAAQARSLVGAEGSLFDANPWLAEVFPNATAPGPIASLRPGTRLQRLLELPLRDRLGDRLERYARRVATARLRVHYRGLGQEVPADVTASFEAGDAIRFHGGHVDQITLERYASRQKQVAARLAAADAKLAAGKRS